MDEFGVLTERLGLKPQGKSAPMSVSKPPITNTARKFSSNSVSLNQKSSSSYGSKSDYSLNVSFFDDQDSILNGQKSQKFSGLDDEFDIFGGFKQNSRQTSNNGNGSSFDYDSIFSNSNYSSTKSSFDGDILGGLNSSLNSTGGNDVLGSFASVAKQSAPVDDLFGNFGAKTKIHNGSVGFDDLIPGFGGSSDSSLEKGENTGINKSAFASIDDPFVVLESPSTTTKSSVTDPLEEFKRLSHSDNIISPGLSSYSPLQKPPPKPGQVLKSEKGIGSDVSSIDELEDFAMGRERNKADRQSDVCHSKDARERQTAKASKYNEAEDVPRRNQQNGLDDLESFFSVNYRSSIVPKSKNMTSDPVFDAKFSNRDEPAVIQRKSNGVSSNISKVSPTPNMFDEFSSIFGDASFSGEFEEVEGESEERRRARFGRHQRTQDRVAKAVADMNQRDLQTQHEQEERRRIADKMDAVIKSWAAGKEGNVRALLSSLQYVLWPECGWKPVSLTDLITSSSVKQVYRKATLFVHPDKVQQKGATLEQKYTAEKVFDILKEAWNKFNKEELS